MLEACSICEQSRGLLHLHSISPSVAQKTKYNAFWGQFNQTFASVIYKCGHHFCGRNPVV